jgi:hypothetical protein
VITDKEKDGATVSYNAERIIGNGSFGVVFQATVVETGEVRYIQNRYSIIREIRFVLKTYSRVFASLLTQFIIV